MSIYPGSYFYKFIKAALNFHCSISYCTLLLGLFLYLNNTVSAQTSQNLRFERFTIEQGLSSDWVQDITQDHLGHIWVATASGVSRYDGYDFTVYRNIPGDFTTLTGNFVNVVFSDSFGNVWVGTNSGLNLYNPVKDSFERIYHEPENDSSLSGSVIHDLFESKSGDLWVGTNNGLSLYDRENHSFVSQWQMNGEYVNLSGIEVVSIAEDANGTLWIASSDNGLITFNPEVGIIRFFNQEPIPGVSFPSSNISKVLADSFGNIWIGFLTNGMQEIAIGDEAITLIDGLGRLNTETNHFTLFKYDPVTQPGLWNLVSDMHETQDSTLWVTTYLQNDICGLHRFDRHTEKFTTYSYDPSDSSSLTWAYATAVYEDRFNNLWVGTSRGLNKADLGKWQMETFWVSPDAPELLLDNFYGIEEIEDGVFWFGLDGRGIIEWNRNTGKITHFNPDNPFSENAEMDISAGSSHIIKKDHSGEIWVGHSGSGVTRANLQTKRTVRYVSNANNSGSLTGNFVTGILVDHMNTVWIATTNGLNRYNRTDDTFTTWTTQNSELGSNSLNAIFEDSRGIIWLGTKEHVYDPKPTRSDGLIKFDPTSESFITYRHDPKNINSLSNDAVNAIDEDENGNLWIATNNGLNRFDLNEASFEQFHVKDGLPDPVVVGLLFDNDGKIWLSTLKGLSRFNPVTKGFRNYDKSDGVQANRFNDFSYYKTKEGELIFGGIAGANYFNPSEIFANSMEPVVHLTNFLVNNSPYELKEPLREIGVTELGWSENSVGFEFIAINFRSPELTEYEYKLEGYDSGWISAGTRRFTNYTNLPSGDYIFMVRAVNAEGITSSVNATIAIRILPPFWKTWWAYGLYLILFVAGISAFDRYQRKRLLQKEKEKALEKELEQSKEIEKAYNNLEVAHENLKSAQEQLVQQEKLASLGQLTAGIAHEIKNPLNFVNNFSEVSIEMIDEIREELANVGANNDSPLPVANSNSPYQTISEILDDIEANLRKIHQHGTRADGIVKSMLLHSRGGDGKMEPIDINAMIREYVNLSFHGMRAGKHPINVDIKMDFDERIKDVPLIVEDFSRVILNLCNNAFDAMRETKDIRLPKLMVRTKKSVDAVIIEIADNGPGIPDNIKDNILQPFFTTKKGTDGTGLGLSITHDIVKAHGGEITINTIENEGTEFTIILPE